MRGIWSTGVVEEVISKAPRDYAHKLNLLVPWYHHHGQETHGEWTSLWKAGATGSRSSQTQGILVVDDEVVHVCKICVHDGFWKSCSECNWTDDFSDHSVETLAEVGGSASERTVILEVTFDSND